MELTRFSGQSTAFTPRQGVDALRRAVVLGSTPFRSLLEIGNRGPSAICAGCTTLRRSRRPRDGPPNRCDRRKRARLSRTIRECASVNWMILVVHLPFPERTRPSLLPENPAPASSGAVSCATREALPVGRWKPLQHFSPSRSACFSQFRIVVAVGSKSSVRSEWVLPFQASSTIWSLIFCGYGGRLMHFKRRSTELIFLSTKRFLNPQFKCALVSTNQNALLIFWCGYDVASTSRDMSSSERPFVSSMNSFTKTKAIIPNPA